MSKKCESTDCEYPEQAIACVSALFLFGDCPYMSMKRVAQNANKRGGALLALNLCESADCAYSCISTACVSALLHHKFIV